MEIKIPYQFNLFLFIANLTEWHFSCRQNFNRIWKRQPYPLSPVEQRQLILFKNALIRYYQKTGEHLTSFFANGRNINWRILSKILDEKDIEVIKETFSLFRSRFNFFYNRQKKNMFAVAQVVKKNRENNQTYLEQTKNLYGCKERKNCDVLIALSEDSNHNSGGIYFASSRKGHIILQFGDFQLKEDHQPILMVFYHELGHHFQENNYWRKLSEKNEAKIRIPIKFKNQGINVKDIIDEPIHTALWGKNGIFTEKIFGVRKSAEKETGSYYYQVELCAQKIKPLVQNYLKNNKKADQELIEHIIRTWNNLNSK